MIHPGQFWVGTTLKKWSVFGWRQQRIVKLLVEKVIVSPNDLEVRLRANGIERLVLELKPAATPQTEEALA